MLWGRRCFPSVHGQTNFEICYAIYTGRLETGRNDIGHDCSCTRAGLDEAVTTVENESRLDTGRVGEICGELYEDQHSGEEELRGRLQN